MSECRLALCVVALLAWIGMGTAWAETEIFALNSFFPWSVTSYPARASGSVAPLRTLQGPATGFSSPTALAADAIHEELFVADEFPSNGVISVFTLTANGNVAPVRIIAGPATQMAGPAGLTVDPASNELFATQVGTSAITVYARTASGNVAPLRAIAGGSTGLTVPLGISVDHVNDELAVADGDTIKFYPRTADGNVPPLRTIGGPSTGLQSPRAISVDAVNNEVAVTNFSNNTVTVYPRTATGNVAPLRTIVLSTYAGGIVLDPVTNELVVTELSFNEVDFFSRTADGDVAPLRTIAGPTTELFAPGSLALARRPVSSNPADIPTLGWGALAGLATVLAFVASLVRRRDAEGAAKTRL